MKLNKLLISFLVIVVITASMFFVSQRNRPSEQRKILYYQSGMHPWITSDKPGKCPICGMDIMPVYEGEEESTKPEQTQAESGNKIVELTKKQFSMLNASTEQVTKRPLFKEIRTVGVVAFDPAPFSI